MAKHYQGKRVATSTASRPKRTFHPAALVLLAGIVLTLVGWGVLVWAAIRFGADARGGDSGAWVFLGLAALAACGMLFATLLLLARLSRALGFTSGGRPVRSVSTLDPDPTHPTHHAPEHDDTNGAGSGGARRAG